MDDWSIRVQVSMPMRVVPMLLIGVIEIGRASCRERV